MKQVSNKRRAQLAKYTIERRLFLRQMICEVCRKRRSIEVHHRRGREGKLLLDKAYWLAVCRVCHDRIHSEPRWARDMGYRQ